MSSVDDRIVNMQFNNKQFTQGVTQSQKSLDGLEKSLQNTAKSKGLTQLDQQVGGMKGKFSAMQIAGVAAVATIASKATAMGLNLAKSFTINPMKQGFQEYQTNLNSIQTIIANTGKKLPVVQGALQDLNRYSDLTIYNFSQMASAIGKFTAAGVKLKPATASIKGMANVAALTGASAEDLNRAMYQTSQALSAGTIRLMDWRSLENANMGTKNMREALMQTASSLGEEGKAMDAALRKHGNFRESLSEGWLTAGVFNKTMKVMAGRYDEASGKTVAYTAAQLKSMGYTDQQAKKMSKLSQAAIDSATVIKTLPQMMDVVRESIGSVWSSIFSGIMGNFNQSKKLWTAVGNSITSKVSKINYALVGKDGKSGILGDWRKEGGRTAVIKGLGNVFSSLGKILGTVGQAFHDVFPPASGSKLAKISKGFESFTKNLIPSAKTLSSLTDIFGGVFSVLHIGVSIVTAIAKGFGAFFGAIFSGSGKARGGILSILGSIGLMLQSLDTFLTSGGKMTDFMVGIGSAAGAFVKPFVQAIGAAIDAVSKLVSGGISIGDFISSIETGFSKLGIPLEKVSAFFDQFTGKADGIKSSFGGVGSSASKLGAIFDTVVQKVQSLNITGDKVASVFKKIGASAGDVAGQAVGIAANIIGGLVSGLMSTGLPALKGAIITLGTSIIEFFKGVLGIHSPAATMIPIGVNIVQGLVQGLISAAKWIGTGIGKIGAFIINSFRTLFGGSDALGLASLMNALFTGALLLTIRSFAGSLKGTISDIRGVIKGAADTFGQLTNTLKTMQKQVQAQIIKAIAIAVGILAVSLIALSFIKSENLMRALGALAALSGIMVGTMKALSMIGNVTDEEGNKVQKGAGQLAILSAAMVAMSTSMLILAGAVAILGNMKPENLAKGIGALALILGMMVGAIKALSGMEALAKGAALTMIGLAIAMNIMAGAVAMFGNMDLGTLIKGIGSLGFVMGMMTDSLVALGANGAGVAAAGAAMVMVAGAMVILTAAVAAFGNMDLGTLIKGIGALAIVLGMMVGAMETLGANLTGTVAAAFAMTMVAGAMGVLSTVVVFLGSQDWGTLIKGMIALGAALIIFGVAIAALGAIGEAVGPGLLMLGGALALIGIGMAAFGVGFALMAATGTAGIAVMTAAISAFIMLLPSIAIQMAAAFVTFIQAIAAASPKVRDAFGTIIKNMLGVLTDAVPQLGKLISALLSELIRIVTAAIPQFGGVFQALISTGIRIVKKSVPQFIEAGYTIIDRFIGSVAKHVPHIVGEAIQLVTNFLKALGDNLPKVADAGLKMIIKFINGVSDAINNNVSQLRTAGLHLAGAIINGMTGGLLSEGLAQVKAAAQKIADALPGWMKKVLHIKSPSQVMRDEVGMQVGAGLAQGIDDSHRRVESSARSLGHKVSKGVAAGISQGITDAVNAAVLMANRVFAAGDAVVQSYQQRASGVQYNAYVAQANADMAKQAANAVKGKKNAKLKRHLQKLADKAQATADTAQGQADAAYQSAQDMKDFNAMSLADKGSKSDENAQAISKQAQAMLAKANAEAAKAAGMANKKSKAYKKLREQAQADAAQAAVLAQQAQDAHNAALQFYGQDVQQRIDAIQKVRAAEAKAAADQKAYDAADTQGKLAILNARMAEQQAIADQKNADAARLLEEAKAVAYSDAAQAMAKLDQSEQAAQDAKDAADAAQQAKDQIEQLTQQTSTSGPTDSGTGPTIQPSRTVLEDAASIIDRYTASLQAAQDAAASQQTVLQYTQNNYSPVALSASEIYRQGKNLLSAQELKMGSNSSP